MPDNYINERFSDLKKINPESDNILKAFIHSVFIDGYNAAKAENVTFKFLKPKKIRVE